MVDRNQGEQQKQCDKEKDLFFLKTRPKRTLTIFNYPPLPHLIFLLTIHLTIQCNKEVRKELKL